MEAAHGCKGRAAELTEPLCLTDAEDRLLWYAAITRPWSDERKAVGRKRMRVSDTTLLLKALRMSTRDIESISNIHAAASSFDALASNRAAPNSRYDLALAMRLAGGRWRSALLLSLASSLLRARAAPPPSPPDDAPASGGGGATAARLLRGPLSAAVLRDYDALWEDICSMGLVAGHDARPPLSGGEVKELVLSKLVSGPVFGLVTDAQLEWVLKNPDQPIDKLKVFLQTKFPEYV